MASLSAEELVTVGQGVLRKESQAILQCAEQLDESFAKAVELCNNSSTVIVSGVGKSGAIGRKISATISSLGTPSFFMHPTEAMHGDLGMVKKDDCIILTSYSGSTEEILGLALVLNHQGNKTIGLTKSKKTRLCQLCDVVLTTGVVEEACPNQLAPTSSTSTMMALGDSLAIAISLLRDFDESQFRVLHPGGEIGTLLTPIEDFLRIECLPQTNTFHKDELLLDVLNKASRSTRRSGALLVVDSAGKLSGIFTDGDLRRSLLATGTSILDQPISTLMTHDPTHINEGQILRDALRVIKDSRIDEIPVTTAEKIPIGILDVQDVIKILPDSIGGDNA